MSKSSSPHIVLFDLYSTGHHRSWLEMLVGYFINSRGQGRLSLVLSRDFRKRHGEFLSALESEHSDRISILEFDSSDQLSGGTQSVFQLFSVSRIHGAAARWAVDRLAPDHILFMYFDHAQMALPSVASSVSECDVTFSGILFRPTFHFETQGITSRIASKRKEILLRRALRSPPFHRLLCLDPEAVDVINSWKISPHPIAARIPDGISRPEPHITRDEQRRLWNCSSETVVFLFFGMVTERKGILSLLRAARILDSSARKRILIVIAGSIPDGERAQVDALMAELGGAIPLILDDRYVPDAEMASMFAACDVVLTPYVGHVGSSNVLVRAAAAGKPVVGPGDGLVGTLIARHQLGLSVDTRDPDALARTLELPHQDLLESFDRQSARDFADYNSPTNFAKEVFATIDRC